MQYECRGGPGREFLCSAGMGGTPWGPEGFHTTPAPINPKPHKTLHGGKPLKWSLS